MSDILAPPIDDTPALLKVTCPKCGERMRLARIDPHRTRAAETSIYDCRCGNTFAQTLELRD